MLRASVMKRSTQVLFGSGLVSMRIFFGSLV
jgi:hypothetical protein